MLDPGSMPDARLDMSHSAGWLLLEMRLDMLGTFNSRFVCILSAASNRFVILGWMGGRTGGMLVPPAGVLILLPSPIESKKSGP